MAAHDYHEGLPGYSPGQILHAGCAECEARAKEPSGGLAHLDRFRFALAWSRASRWQSGTGDLPDLDRAEIPMLQILWTVQLKLGEFGVPIGTMPIGAAEHWGA